MNNPVYNIILPYNAPVAGGICPGRIVRVAGNTPPNAHKFAINLICGPNGDIAIHVSPHFNEGRVVFNSVQHMSWGHEEVHHKLPIFPGQSFEIIIFCDASHYKVAFNGQHFAQFSHRVPLTHVTNLGIDGDVIITSITSEGSGNFGPNTGYTNPPVHAGSYPPQPGVASYPRHSHPQTVLPNTPYPPLHAHAPYPVQPGGHIHDHRAHDSTPHYPHSPNSHKKVGIFDKAGMAVAGALGATTLLGGGPKYNKLGMLGAGAGGLGATLAGAAMTGNLLHPKKALKKQAKAHKKALKYGLPIAGAGLGVYALGKGVKKLGHRRSSSSSSSSSSD